MELFKKRETLIQNIAFMAIMAAINVVFVVLSNVLPVLLFLLVFVLPLTSTLVTIYCKKIYFPIYFVVTLALCFGVSAGFYIFDTFIYVLPSLITGFIFGFCIEKKVPAIYALLIATVVQYGLTILTFFILGKIVSNLDLTESIIIAFGLKDFEFKAVFIQVFLFIIAEIQIVISYIVTKVLVNRLGIEVNLTCKHNFILYNIEIVFAGLAILSYYYFPVYTLVLVLFPLPIYIYQIATLILKKKIWIWASLGGIHLVFIFLFAFLYEYTVAPNHFILIYVLFGLSTIIDVLSNYCFKENKNNIK